MAPGIVDLLFLLAKCQDLLFFGWYLLYLLFLLVSGLADQSHPWLLELRVCCCCWPRAKICCFLFVCIEFVAFVGFWFGCSESSMAPGFEDLLLLLAKGLGFVVF